METLWWDTCCLVTVYSVPRGLDAPHYYRWCPLLTGSLLIARVNTSPDA